MTESVAMYLVEWVSFGRDLGVGAGSEGEAERDGREPLGMLGAGSQEAAWASSRIPHA